VIKKGKSEMSLKQKCEFKFVCDREWDDLIRAQDDKKRHCSRCEKDVVLCETSEELNACRKERKCVCYKKLDSSLLLGLPSDLPINGKKLKDFLS